MTQETGTTERVEHAKKLAAEVQAWPARKLLVTYSQLDPNRKESSRFETQQASSRAENSATNPES